MADIKKKSVTFSVPPNFVAQLEMRADLFPGMNRSSQLMADLSNYWSILENGLARARKILTQREAQMILDIQNGSYLGTGSEVVMWMQTGLLHNVSDGMDLSDYHVKWGVDREVVMYKLTTMGDVPRLSLIDWCSRMWGRHENGGLWSSEISQFLPDENPELMNRNRAISEEEIHARAKNLFEKG
jgi:hypothetical protein